MHLKFIRSTGIIFGITAILLIAPTVCAASMGMPAGMESSSPCQQDVSSSRCLTASSDAPSHCVLIKAMGEVTPPKLISYQNVCPSRALENYTDTEPSQSQATPYQKDLLKIPLSTPTEHHCRNTTTSEEHPL